jgi:hypothetical protein
MLIRATKCALELKLMSAKNLLFIVLPSLLLIVGCASSTNWVKPGVTEAEFYEQDHMCQQRARQAAGGGRSAAPQNSGDPYAKMGAAVGNALGSIAVRMRVNREYKRCMEAHGYREE